MSADNYNVIIQLPNGKWILSANHSMSDLMSREEYDAYNKAFSQVRPGESTPQYDTQSEAYNASDLEESEYGTFSHEWRDWFENYE